MKSATAPQQDSNTPEHASGRVMTRRAWFGRMGVGAFLASAAPALLSGCGRSQVETAFAAAPVQRGSLQPLKDSAGQKNILYGAATGQQYLRDDADFIAQFAKHCAVLTPENELKWDTVEPLPGLFNFAPADFMAD